MQIFLSSA